VVDVDNSLGRLKGAAPGDGARPELTLIKAATGGQKTQAR
jgi:hypothetical protein